MWENFKGLVAQPYKGAEKMDFVDWFAFIGVLIVIIILWNVILYHIKQAV